MNELHPVLEYFPLVSGAYLVGMSLILHTSNLRSSLTFKVVPFFLGIGCLYVGTNIVGWI